MYLVKSHQLRSVHFLSLVEWYEANIIRGQSLICKRPLDRVQIMGSNGHQGSLSSKILVEFVLQADERFVACLVEGNIPQNGARHVRSNPRGLSVVIYGSSDQRL